MNPTRNPQSSIRKRWCLATLLISSFVISHSSFAQSTSPQVIPFQGRLTNQAGDPYTKGQYSIIFNLYTQAVGGSTLWTERHEKVGVVNGMVNVFLGSINSMSAVDFSTVKYLGITVDVDNNPATSDPEMVPRQMIIPAFWAKQADNSTKLVGNDWSAIMVDGTNQPSNNPSSGFLKGAKIAAASVTSIQLAANAVTTAQIADGSVNTTKIADGTITRAKLDPNLSSGVNPPGSIVAYGGTSAPAGYLMCDGTAYNRTGTYASLFTAISTNFGAPDATTFNVPDLRGQFLRGAIPSLQLTFTGSPSSNIITVVSHPFNRTGMRVRVTSPLTGLTAGTDYFIIVVSPTQLAFSDTLANALAGTKLTLSGSASGMVVTQSEDPDAATRTAMAIGGTGTGFTIGSVQADEFKSHTHGGVNNQTQLLVSGGSNYGLPTAAGNTSATGGSETRPKNAYVNYIIKY